MGVEKQIHIETKEQSEIDLQDQKDIKTINDFLLFHEAGKEEETEKTIKDSKDNEVTESWNRLIKKFESRLKFVDNDPSPQAYDLTFKKIEFSGRPTFSDSELKEKEAISENINMATNKSQEIERKLAHYENMINDKNFYKDEFIKQYKSQEEQLNLLNKGKSDSKFIDEQVANLPKDSDQFFVRESYKNGRSSIDDDISFLKESIKKVQLKINLGISDEEKKLYEEKIIGLKQDKVFLDNYIESPTLDGNSVSYENIKGILRGEGNFNSIKSIQEKNNILKSYEYYDKQMENIVENMKNLTYLQRLMTEFNCDKKTALEHQEVRIKNAIHGGYYLTNTEFGSANFDPQDKTTHLPQNYIATENPYVAVHEILGHKVTNASGDESVDGFDDSGLSDSCKKLLKQSTDIRVERGTSGYIPKDTKIGPINYINDRPGYFEKYTERYARKKVMDFEMENLGIKKYTEKFTENHYNKMVSLYNESIKNMKEGKESILSRNTIEFIETTKKDPKIYAEIFNNIA